jgi:hypothetical protein
VPDILPLGNKRKREVENGEEEMRKEMKNGDTEAS